MPDMGVDSRHELCVLVYGSRSETAALLVALDQALGNHDVGRLYSGEVQQKSEQRWRFAFLNDAMHAVELAHGILSQTGGLPWRLWLSSDNEFVIAHANETGS
jgi:hypothetical protein